MTLSWNYRVWQYMQIKRPSQRSSPEQATALSPELRSERRRIPFLEPKFPAKKRSNGRLRGKKKKINEKKCCWRRRRHRPKKEELGSINWYGAYQTVTAVIWGAGRLFMKPVPKKKLFSSFSLFSLFSSLSKSKTLLSSSFS
jgi:hypothetical protein